MYYCDKTITLQTETKKFDDIFVCFSRDINNHIAKFICCNHNEGRCGFELKTEKVDYFMNKYNRNRFNFIKNKKMMEYKNISYLRTETINMNTIHKIILDEGYIIKNLKIQNLQNVKYIDLEIGGQLFNRLYMTVFKAYKFLYDINDENTLPFYFSKYGISTVKYHNIRIIINYKNRCLNNMNILSYDIYKWNDNIPTERLYFDDTLDCIGNPYEMLILQSRFCGDELIGSNYTKLKLCWNGQINCLIIHNYNPEILKLIISTRRNFGSVYNSETEEILKLKKCYDDNNISIYPIMNYNKSILIESMNFTFMNIKVIIENKKNQTIQIHGTSINFLRSINGMMGMAIGG